MTNIILIGMPGAGKSTSGVILAKMLCMNFIDTDILIQERQGRPLQQIIDSEGIKAFLGIEEECILSIDNRSSVIASGGSAVYSDMAMKHLKSRGIAVYLKVSMDETEKRIKNISTRGIVLDKGQSLSDIYMQRCPLYEEYADIIVDCTGKSVEDVVGTVADMMLNAYKAGKGDAIHGLGS